MRTLDEWAVIASFDEVPIHFSGTLVRLPRCALCYEQIHRYEKGHAFCTAVQGHYRRMDNETAARWDQAEAEDRATRKIDRE